jgi:hypothetical protein
VHDDGVDLEMGTGDLSLDSRDCRRCVLLGFPDQCLHARQASATTEDSHVSGRAAGAAGFAATSAGSWRATSCLAPVHQDQGGIADVRGELDLAALRPHRRGHDRLVVGNELRARGGDAHRDLWVGQHRSSRGRSGRGPRLGRGRARSAAHHLHWGAAQRHESASVGRSLAAARAVRGLSGVYRDAARYWTFCLVGRAKRCPARLCTTWA